MVRGAIFYCGVSRDMGSFRDANQELILDMLNLGTM